MSWNMHLTISTPKLPEQWNRLQEKSDCLNHHHQRIKYPNSQICQKAMILHLNVADHSWCWETGFQDHSAHRGHRCSCFGCGYLQFLNLILKSWGWCLEQANTWDSSLTWDFYISEKSKALPMFHTYTGLWHWVIICYKGVWRQHGTAAS